MPPVPTGARKSSQWSSNFPVSQRRADEPEEVHEPHDDDQERDASQHARVAIGSLGQQQEEGEEEVEQR